MANIVLIDDDSLTRELLGRLLTELGHTVSLAADGVEGLKAIGTQSTDLVITDLVMPNKEGIETIMELRRVHPQVKIIAISGGRDPGFVERNLLIASRLGANQSLKKPFTREQLERALADALHPKQR